MKPNLLLRFLRLITCAGFLCSFYHSAYCEQRVDPNLAQKPSIIWFHNAATTQPKWLDVVLSSGLITRVLILYMHPTDVSYDQKVVWDAIAVCRKYQVPVIWSRTLFPSDNPGRFVREDLFKSGLYERIVDQIKNEAAQLGCVYTGIDTEAYGAMPLKSELKKPLNASDFQKLSMAVNAAVQKKGRLDYVLPAVCLPSTHPYNALIQLGRLKIAEHTYYDNPALIHDTSRPYDVMGVYLNISRENPSDSLKRPFFTPQNIFLKPVYPIPKEGLMLYPKEDSIPGVAEALTKIEYVNGVYVPNHLRAIE